MRGTILLFEEDADVRRLVMDLLGEEGYDVYSVQSLERAARLAGSVRFDLFLADSGVPTRELALERFRRWCEYTGGKMPVIAFTAHNIDLDEARAVGCADAIPKPFDVDELLSRIERCLRETSYGLEIALWHPLSDRETERVGYHREGLPSADSTPGEDGSPVPSSPGVLSSPLSIGLRL